MRAELGGALPNLRSFGPKTANGVQPPFPFDWAFCPGLGAILGKKCLFLAQNCADLGGHLPTWRHRPGPPPLIFLLKTCIWQGNHIGTRMAKVESSPRRWEGAMGKTRLKMVMLPTCWLEGLGASCRPSAFPTVVTRLLTGKVVRDVAVRSVGAQPLLAVRTIPA